MTNWKELNEAADELGLSEEAILKFNSMLHMPDITVNDEGITVVDFDELREWIILMGTSCFNRFGDKSLV